MTRSANLNRPKHSLHDGSICMCSESCAMKVLRAYLGCSAVIAWLPATIGCTKLQNRVSNVVYHTATMFFSSSFFSFLSSSKVVLSCGCCVEPHNYDSHVAVRATFLTEHCGTFVKFLPQPLFLGCLLRFCPPGSASFSFYARHGLLD